MHQRLYNASRAYTLTHIHVFSHKHAHKPSYSKPLYLQFVTMGASVVACKPNATHLRGQLGKVLTSLRVEVEVSGPLMLCFLCLFQEYSTITSKPGTLSVFNDSNTSDTHNSLNHLTIYRCLAAL